jgi:hypothetical protein
MVLISVTTLITREFMTLCLQALFILDKEGEAFSGAWVQYQLLQVEVLSRALEALSRVLAHSAIMR